MGEKCCFYVLLVERLKGYLMFDCKMEVMFDFFVELFVCFCVLCFFCSKKIFEEIILMCFYFVGIGVLVGGFEVFLMLIVVLFVDFGLFYVVI